MLIFDSDKYWKLFLFIIFFLLADIVKASVTDTIYIYETVNITDTVWLDVPTERDTIEIYPLERIQNATLLLDTTNFKGTLIYFYSNKSATIPINRILIDENQLKHTKMKKAGFFTLMFLAFQSITYAQPELSVKAGISQFWNIPFFQSSDGPCFGDHAGFEIKGPIKNSNFSFSLGYELHGFGKEFDLNFISREGNLIQHNKIKEIHRSIPVLFYYQYKKLELFFGYEYRFVDYSYQAYSEEGYTISSYRNEHGLSTGIEYSINNRLSLYGKLYLGDVFEKKGVNISTTGSSLDLSLKYYINRNRIN